MELCNFKSELCNDAFECIKTLILVNNHTASLRCMMIPANFDFILDDDQEFLRQLILKLHVCGEEYDATHIAARAFTDLITVLCKYYEIIMVEES